MLSTIYTFTAMKRGDDRVYSLNYAYKRDKNAVLKLMEIRNDYEVIVIHKDTLNERGQWIKDDPFISWESDTQTLTAYGKNNPYSRPADRDKYESDITPWYITAGNLD